MRCVAGAGLLALVGCNQIFGIAPTQPYDAAPDVPPDLPHVVLDWQIATVFAAGTAQPGAPNPMPGFAPIDPAPRIRIALLNDPTMIDAGNPILPALAAASYSSSDGFIAIPRDQLHGPQALAVYAMQLQQLVYEPARGTWLGYDSPSGQLVRISVSAK